LGKRIGINDKISAGAEAVRAVENKYHVSLPVVSSSLKRWPWEG